MILWTIQHKEAYLKMQSSGVLRADANHLFCEDDFRDAYDWMSCQMKKLISEPPDGVQYPVWLWHTWEGNRKRPDMRRSGYAPSGASIVLLTVDVPDEKVLLSDFDCWHAVLNGNYLATSEEDDCSHSPEEIAESWNGIFDVSSVNTYYSYSLSIQATTWEIQKEWIKKAECFTAR